MRKLKLPCLAVLLGVSALQAADFKQAVVVLPSSPTTPERKAAQMLVEEITKRTQARLKIASQATPGLSGDLSASGLRQTRELHHHFK